MMDTITSVFEVLEQAQVVLGLDAGASVPSDAPISAHRWWGTQRYRTEWGAGSGWRSGSWAEGTEEFVRREITASGLVPLGGFLEG